MHYAFSAAALVVLQLVAQVSGAAVVAGRPTFTVRIGRCVVGGTTYDSAPTTLSGGGASASQGSSVTTSGNGGPISTGNGLGQTTSPSGSGASSSTTVARTSIISPLPTGSSSGGDTTRPISTGLSSSISSTALPLSSLGSTTTSKTISTSSGASTFSTGSVSTSTPIRSTSSVPSSTVSSVSSPSTVIPGAPPLTPTTSAGPSATLPTTTPSGTTIPSSSTAILSTSSLTPTTTARSSTTILSTTPTGTTVSSTTASIPSATSTEDQLQVLLARPTPAITQPDASDFYQGDDVSFNIVLPFTLKLFNDVSSSIFVSTNGLLTFNTGSESYANAAFVLSSLPTLTLAAYWEDLIAEGGTQQGIYYQLDNVNSQPSVTFEYILANLGIQDEFFHFLVNYDSSNPGVIKVYYFVAGDSGLEATVGIQGTGANGPQAIPYSNNGSPPIAAGQVVTFDTNVGTASLGNFNNACYTPNSWPNPSCL